MSQRLVPERGDATPSQTIHRFPPKNPVIHHDPSLLQLDRDEVSEFVREKKLGPRQQGETAQKRNRHPVRPPSASQDPWISGSDKVGSSPSWGRHVPWGSPKFAEELRRDVLPGCSRWLGMLQAAPEEGAKEERRSYADVVRLGHWRSVVAPAPPMSRRRRAKVRFCDNLSTLLF